MSRYLYKGFRSQRQSRHKLLRRPTVDATPESDILSDVGLDYAVRKDRNLQPVWNIKNFIMSEPSKSLPISVIADCKDKFGIRIRPVEFLRRYPRVFEEYLPDNVGVYPHFKLTQDALELHSEEQSMYQSDEFRRGAAERLLKLLMLCRVNEIPLGLIEKFRWDLGLPDDFANTLVPEFPHYFRVKKSMKSGSTGDLLDLYCWDSEMAVSVMERKAAVSGYQKGMPIEFPMPQGYKIDKDLKEWTEKWDKLPYVSPYENASHLQSKSDQSDRWVTAVLHEFLHILPSKKMERDVLLEFGEYLGLSSRFKLAFTVHPGIFYLSFKNGTCTVVLREGFQREMLVDYSPWMLIRNQYSRLMRKLKGPETLKEEDGLKKKKLNGKKWASDGEDDDSEEEYSQFSREKRATRVASMKKVSREKRAAGVDSMKMDGLTRVASRKMYGGRNNGRKKILRRSG